MYLEGIQLNIGRRTMSKIIDVSWPISEHMTTYKNKKPVKVVKHAVFEKDGMRDSSLLCSMHTGTHVDAPSHFLLQGCSIDRISLEQMNGLCRVVDLSHVMDEILLQDLAEHNPQEGERLLLKTRNSQHNTDDRFDFSFISLSYDAALFLVERKVQLIGVDGLGIERNQPGHPVHKALFAEKIVIVEGLRLVHVIPGSYQFICAPLLIHGAEAAPCRAFLIKS